MNRWLAGGVVGVGLIVLTFGGWNSLTGAPETPEDAVERDRDTAQQIAVPAPMPAPVPQPVPESSTVEAEPEPQADTQTAAVTPAPVAESGTNSVRTEDETPTAEPESEPGPETIQTQPVDAEPEPQTAAVEPEPQPAEVTEVTPEPQPAEVTEVTPEPQPAESDPEPQTAETEQDAQTPEAETGGQTYETLSTVETSEAAQEPEEIVVAAVPSSPDEAAPAQAGGATEPQGAVTTETTENTEPAEPKEEDRSLPRFDLVRVDADGQTIIAGKAAPGERVDILLDGEVIGEAEADGSGAFVGIVTAPLSGDAQQLQLRTRAAEPEPVEPSVEDTQLAAADPVAETPDAKPEGAAQPEPVTQSVPDEETATEEEEVQPAPQTSQDAEPQSAAGVNEVALQPSAETEVETETTAQTTPEPQPVTAAPEIQSTPAIVPPPAQGTSSEDTRVARAEPAQPAAQAEDSVTVEEPPSYAISAPVIILPSTAPDAAPALVQPKEDQVALLQPQGVSKSVTLDAIRYGETGAVQLNGRGHPGNSVRIYGNGDRLGDTGIRDNGTWAWALARERALGIRLFRFDELDLKGTVASRIETPFTYQSSAPKLVRQREVVIQRGNNLWTIAEQFYGEGLRFSVIYGANSDLIRDPDLIYPGQVFSVPELVDAE